IYRVNVEMVESGDRIEIAQSVAPLAPSLISEFGEVETAVRLKRVGPTLVNYEDRAFYEQFFYADANLFELFSFSLLRGNPNTALADPYKAVITQEIAEKYFAGEDPVGRSLNIDNRFDVTVTGILDEIPRNSHFRFDILVSFSSLNTLLPQAMDSWGYFEGFFTYILVHPGFDPVRFEAGLPDFLRKYGGEPIAEFFTLKLQPLSDIHLSPAMHEIAAQSDSMYSYLFVSIALFILVIACINFMNLSTARSLRRSREVGLRKVLGAVRAQLIRQFLGESILMTCIALLIALGLVILFLPLFNDLTSAQLSFSELNNPVFIGGVLLVTLATGIIAGSYPALFLSSFKPTSVFRSGITRGSFGNLLRKILVVLQFAISIVLIIGTGIVFEQTGFMKEKGLGFDKENIIVTRLRGEAMRNQHESFRNELLQHPGVTSVTLSNGTPGSNDQDVFAYQAEDQPEGEGVSLQTLSVDYDYISTYNHDIIAGRNFSRDFPSDSRSSYIVNESAVRLLGWEQPLGKFLNQGDDAGGQVIGVVRDFHYFSVRTQIEPIVFRINPASYRYASIKIRETDVPSTLKFIEDTWKKFAQGYPYQSYFLDENFNSLYQNEERMMRVFGYCSFLAVLIACLGLFGLASFAAEQRTKEIGIRKVLGSSVAGIVALFTREFTILVILSNLLAWPAAYYYMNNWLAEFPYRTGLSVTVFIVAALLALLISLLTVGFQAFRAARTDPVKALRYE
ncbi:FtsX-like permease family protein, partial [candidate division KSB1 bacterium]